MLVGFWSHIFVFYRPGNPTTIAAHVGVIFLKTGWELGSLDVIIGQSSSAYIFKHATILFSSTGLYVRLDAR